MLLVAAFGFPGCAAGVEGFRLEEFPESMGAIPEALAGVPVPVPIEFPVF
jgi:hypothetical protein